MDAYDLETIELRKLNTLLKMFSPRDSVCRCKDGPGFFLMQWVDLPYFEKLRSRNDSEEQINWYATIEELVDATNAAITAKANL